MKAKVPFFRCLAIAMFALCMLHTRPLSADGSIPELSINAFVHVIRHASHPVLVEFKAKWCPYCKKELPDIEHLRLERMGSLDVYQVDVEDEPDIAADYDAHILPTLIILNNGVEVDRSEGARYGDDLTSWVDGVEHDIKNQKAVESDSPQPL